MNEMQLKIMGLFQSCGEIPSKLRIVQEMTHAKSPQHIKHHIDQLVKKGLIKIDKKRKVIKKIGSKNVKGMISIPYKGEVIC